MPEYKRWQYTYSGWIRLIKCKELTKEEESAFHDRLWEDREFSDKIRKEFEDWQAEEPDIFLEEEELEGKEFSKKKSRRRTNKGTFHGKSRGKYVAKD